MSKSSIRKAGATTALVVSGLVAGGVLAGSMSASAATSTPTHGSAPAGVSAPAQGRGAGTDTAVTGTEADKVKAAVTAAHSGVTITTVRKDPDGSYDALGTDASGNPVFYDVSADLTTITAGGGHGGPGGPRGAGQDKAVTGTEADKVKAAVTAAHSGVTITTVRKDPDGSYDALGTDASGNPVFFDVSADLKTITAGGGHGGPGGPRGQAPAASPSPSA